MLLLTPFENAEAKCACQGKDEAEACAEKDRTVASEEKPTKEEAPKAEESEEKPVRFPQTYPRPH